MEENSKKYTNKKPEKDDHSLILEIKEGFQTDQNISNEVMNVIDDALQAMISDDINEHKDELKNENETNDLDTKIPINIENSVDMKDKTFTHLNADLKILYEEKLKELNDKVENYQEKYQKLEEISENYKKRNQELIQKRKEYEQSKEELEIKIQALEESKNDFQERSEKLQEVREQFIKLSKEIEEKKSELEKKEKEFLKMHQSLEKSKYELEKSKIDLKKEKLEFELKREEYEKEAVNKVIDKFPTKAEENQTVVEREKKLRGKSEVLQDLLKKLCDQGFFHSCFLIDSKGMMISEYNKYKIDAIAIGAMFSLVCTSALRTVKSLNLQELNYFKLASGNGEFIGKNININNYDRNFILLTYHNKITSTIPKSKKINKKIINQIVKIMKKDFSEEQEISFIIDNLIDRIDFIKKKYETPTTDLELIRIDKINETSIKIKELFEK